MINKPTKLRTIDRVNINIRSASVVHVYSLTCPNLYVYRFASQTYVEYTTDQWVLFILHLSSHSRYNLENFVVPTENMNDGMNGEGNSRDALERERYAKY